MHPEYALTQDRLIVEEAMRYLPGGAIHAGGYHKPAPPDTFLHHGTGAYVCSTSGQRFLDVVLGSASLLLGHCPPAVVVSSTCHGKLELEMTLAAMNSSLSAIKAAGGFS